MTNIEKTAINNIFKYLKDRDLEYIFDCDIDYDDENDNSPYINIQINSQFSNDIPDTNIFAFFGNLPGDKLAFSAIFEIEPEYSNQIELLSNEFEELKDIPFMNFIYDDSDELTIHIYGEAPYESIDIEFIDSIYKFLNSNFISKLSKYSDTKQFNNKS